MNKHLFIVGVLLVIILQGCGPDKMNPVEYLDWYSKSRTELQKQKIIGDYVFKVQYKPADLLLANKIVRGGNLVDTSVKDELQYVDLTIDLESKTNFMKDGIQTEQEFQIKQYYFSFGFQKDIYLEDGDEKLPCVLYHYERSYDIKSAKTFVLGFPKGKSDNIQDKTLVIDSHNLPTGIVKIRVEKENIRKIPQLIASSL